jgi:hypothetical protein
VKLGTENRKQMIAAAALGVLLVLIVVYEFMPSSSTIASTAPVTTSAATDPLATPANTARPAARRSSAPVKKERPAQSLDPTLHLKLLAVSEAIKYEGSGRNIFVSQAEVFIPTPGASGATDKPDKRADGGYHLPGPPAATPIPLKYFGLSNRPGEPKKVFLVKGDDVFIAGEGEIVDRRYKVVRITPTSVDIQDVVGSGPPQTIPLTQGNPS